MRAIIYCRKSTDRSDRQQLSISAQETNARKIAEREGLEVVEVFKETMSAKEP
jgi:DNA invertase Pin-like site-specific DNA recombinase